MTTPVTPVLPLGTAPDTDNFVVESQAPAIGFLKRGVQPPSSVYVEVTDVLMFACASNQIGEQVTVSYRLLRADGVMIHGQFTIQPPASRAIAAHTEPLAEGFLLSVSCKAAVATTRGMTFARAFLTKASLGPGQPSYMLMADYVTTAMAPAHPNGRQLAPSEGPGWRHSVVGTAPSLGAFAAINVPTNARYRFVSGECALFTDAVAGNRTLDTTISVAGNASHFGVGETQVPPSRAWSISLSTVRNVPPAGVNVTWIPLPIDEVCLGGDFMAVNAVGLDPGDQFSAITLAIEEWLDNV